MMSIESVLNKTQPWFFGEVCHEKNSNVWVRRTHL